MERVWNFSAGPATLPVEALERAADDLVCHPAYGMSVLELSHRSKDWIDIQDRVEASLREILGVPETHAVFFLGGGASMQFSMVPLNILPAGRSADFVLTGAWTEKALEEVERIGKRGRIAASTKEEGYVRLPAAFDFDPEAAYVHFTSNNTIFGTQWPELPDVGGVPVVCDASSDILSRPIDVSRYGILFAGAQKNIGPAGVTVVIIREDLLDRAPDDVPTMLAYKTHAEKSSRFNTPPTYAIYMAGLVLDWTRELGGLEAVQARNAWKADRLYAAMDGEFYRAVCEPSHRSQMNVVFRLPSSDLEAAFVEQADRAGLKNLKGHRSVGGIRASIYNAMPPEGIEALVGFMDAFRARHGG